VLPDVVGGHLPGGPAKGFGKGGGRPEADRLGDGGHGGRGPGQQRLRPVEAARPDVGGGGGAERLLHPAREVTAAHSQSAGELLHGKARHVKVALHDGLDPLAKRRVGVEGRARGGLADGQAVGHEGPEPLTGGGLNAGQVEDRLGREVGLRGLSGCRWGKQQGGNGRDLWVRPDAPVEGQGAVRGAEGTDHEVRAVLRVGGPVGRRVVGQGLVLETVGIEHAVGRVLVQGRLETGRVGHDEDDGRRL